MGEQIELACSTGKIVARIGDRFTDHSGEWEIVSFDAGRSYSPSSLGGTRNVILKPIGQEMPSWLRRYARDDGTIEFCGDSVAASLLDKQDGKRRDARGDFLNVPASTPHPWGGGMMSDIHDYEDDDCWNCGGEGRVNDCIDGCCVDQDDIYCPYCSKRCDICNPAPKKQTDELREVLAEALKANFRSHP